MINKKSIPSLYRPTKKSINRQEKALGTSKVWMKFFKKMGSMSFSKITILICLKTWAFWSELKYWDKPRIMNLLLAKKPNTTLAKINLKKGKLLNTWVKNGYFLQLITFLIFKKCNNIAKMVWLRTWFYELCEKSEMANENDNYNFSKF
jgi:hypothetical protein